MCRIAGFVDFNYHGDYELKETLVAMRDTMTYGGPDDAGLYIEKENGLALGHRRLSILDLSTLGHQPMANDDGRLLITYNGEVYNFKDIRRELEGDGYRFRSNSDTEVVLKAYERWGMDAIHRFRGMWAFAIWDKRVQKLILCRDRVGVKPLYWYYANGLFLFASELKAFHKHPRFQKEVDPRSLSLYLQYGYITSPYSIFKNTYKLEPGHYLEIDQKGKIEKVCYWNIKDYYPRGLEDKDKWENRTEEEIADELEGILTESFKLRMVSDVPVGVFLSGGIDSSLVTTILQKQSAKPLKTFTIGFHEREFNEAPWAKKVSAHLGTDHTELYCTPKDAFEIIPKLPELFDEPFGDSSAIPAYLLSRLAKQQVKVVLSADGGDELFCGYLRYRIFDKSFRKLDAMPPAAKGLLLGLLNRISPDQVARLYERTKDFLPGASNIRGKYTKLRRVLKDGNLFEKYLNLLSVFRDQDFGQLRLPRPYALDFETDFSRLLDDITLLMAMDFRTYLPDDLLTKLDRATMSVALEGREPFLDHQLLEYAAMLPNSFKYRNGKSKYILRKILYRHVPANLIDRPKQGFGVPVFSWFNDKLKGLYLEYLNEDRIRREGVFDAEYVGALLKRYFSGKDADPCKLWHLFSFQLWNERWGSGAKEEISSCRQGTNEL